MTNSQHHLSYLGWRLIEPAPFLRPYVKSYWVLWRNEHLQGLHEEYIHPGGGYGVVFNLGDAFYVDGQPVRERIFLDGSNTVSRRLGFAGRIAAIGIRFEPGGAYPFLGVPLYELANHLTLLDAVPSQPLNDLYEQIMGVTRLHTRISQLETWLLQRLHDDQMLAKLVPASLALIRAQAGQVSMKQLANDLYISQRQLERLYRTQVGMTPSQYARLVRVERARDLLKTHRHLSAAQVGAALGFYDQSHFIRDFKSIIGVTPHRYQQYSQAKRANN